MKLKKHISVLLAAVMSAAVFSGFAITASAAAINNGVADGMRVGSVGNGVSADYANGVLTLSGTGTINCTTGLYGAALTGSSQDLIIQLADGANVTLQGIDKGTYSYGIYQYGGSVTVKGNGTLTVNSAAGSVESIGICTYNDGKGSLYIKDNATVIANGAGATGIGVKLYYDNNKIELSNGGKLIASGESGAVNKVPLADIGYATAKASTSADGLNPVDFNADDLSSYKYVELQAEKEVESGIYIGSKMLTSAGMTIGGVDVAYNAANKEVTLSGTGTIASTQININGVNTCGAAIFTANSDILTINLADGANITLEGRSNENYSESYTIYSVSSGIRIAGNGTLTVKAPVSLSSSIYRQSNAIQTGKSLTITRATVKAIGLESAGGYGSRGVAAGSVAIEDDGELIAQGATRAIQLSGSTALTYYDTAIVSASGQYDGANAGELVNEYENNIKGYKYISIMSPNPKIAYENDGETIVFHADTVLNLAEEKHTKKQNQLFVGWEDENGEPVENNITYAKGTKLTARYIDYNAYGEQDFVVSKAQFRTANNIHEEGLRFIVDVSNKMATEITPTEYGVVAIPLEIAGISEPELGKTYIYNGKTYSVGAVTADKLFSQNDEGFRYTMCITDLGGKYTRQYNVRGYIKYNDINGIANVIYTECYGANAYQTAKADFADETITGPRRDALTAALEKMEAERSTEKALYMSQTKTDVVGTSDDMKNWIYKLDNGVMVREAEIDSGKGGDPVEIVQITDIHFNYCNDKDFLENNKQVMDSWNSNGWLKDGVSFPNALACMKYASYADKTIVTGDTLSYLSWGNIALMNKSIWQQDPEALIAIGNHDPRRAINGSSADNAAESELYSFLQSQWKHDLYYTSEIINDKVMVVVMDNQKCKFRGVEYDLLAADIADARAKGIPMLIFEHVAIPTKNPAESAVAAIRVGDTSKTVYNFYEGDAYLLKYGQGDTDSDKVYDLIVNNADVIKGIFCGDLHEDMYTEVKAKTADGQDTVIPQYILNGAAYDKGHVLKITVK